MIVGNTAEAYQILKLVDCSKLTPGRLQDASIQELVAGARHWPDEDILACVHPARPPDRFCALLSGWLIGVEPPPRCQAAEEDTQAAADDMPFLCLNIVHQKGGYCPQLHGCNHSVGCALRRTKVESRVAIPFCDLHRCVANDGAGRGEGNVRGVERIAEGMPPCPKAIVAGGSFCSDHSCRACVHFNKQLGTPVRKAEPNACADHQCQGPDCDKIMRNPNVSFCSEHCCPACNTEHGGSVRQRLPGRPFCDEHSCAEDGCLNACLPSMHGVVQTLCEAHACVVCDGPKQLLDPLCPASRLCFNHRCQNGNFGQLDWQQGLTCPMQRLDGSFFCPEHSCKICCMGLPHEPPESIMPAVHAYPRNVCTLHPLCSFMSREGEQCEQLADGSGFCAKHERSARTRLVVDERLIQQQCHGVTAKRNKPCKTKGMAPASRTFYCNAHLDQAPEESSEEGSEGESEESEEFEDAAEDVPCVDGAASFWAASNALPPPPPPPHSLPLVLAVSQPTPPPLPPPLPLHPPLHLPLPSLPPPQAPINARRMQTRSMARNGKERAADQSEPPDDDSSDDEEMARAIAASRSESNLGDGSSAAVANSDSITDATGLRDTVADDAAADASEPTFENAPEPPRHDMNPDEMDVEEEVMFELNEEQQRLQQVLGEELHFEAEEEFHEAHEITADPVAADAEALVASMRNWAWSAPPLTHRWAEVAVFLRGAAGVVTELRGLAQPHLDEARQRRAEASADAFKKARLIACTVVGGVRRIEALRAAEPFAAVVEEACEVMEPTLMAVLSLRSLQKLELVGDQRQLPAAVPNAWFNLQSAIPSIKISLFERLVTGAAGRGGRLQDDAAVAPCTVLDEQRRMRPAISDLTRGHYADLVAIQDHACTVAQRIGDRSTGATMRTLQLERASWASEGVLVPGVAAQEFFWDLPNNELGRPTAGDKQTKSQLLEPSVHCHLPSALPWQGFRRATTRRQRQWRRLCST